MSLKKAADQTVSGALIINIQSFRKLKWNCNFAISFFISSLKFQNSSWSLKTEADKTGHNEMENLKDLDIPDNNRKPIYF